MSNIILTNISRMRKGVPFQNYHTDDEEIIRGRYTNEAPVKYLLGSIYKGAPNTDCTIIAVTTPEAQEAFMAFRKTIQRYCKRNNYSNLSIECITYDKNFGMIIAEIINRVKKEDRIYIDTTGGFRDSVYILMASVRILEYSGVRLEKAVYSVLNNIKPSKKSQTETSKMSKRKPNKPNRIDDITDTYSMFNLINAVNSFTSYGNSDELEKFFEKSNNDIIKSAVKAMKKFSDNITLCRTKSINEDMKELNYALSKLTELTTEAPETVLFGALAELIKRKFNISEKNNKIELPGIVKWCADNKLIQQAVTIYVERMPEYFYDKEFYSVADDVLNECVNSKSNFDWHYELFYNKFMRLEAPKAAKVKLLPIEDIINNDIENDFITKKALIESKSVEAFRFKAKQISKIMPKGSETEKAMNEFFKLKNTIFLGGKRKSVAELNEAKHKEPRFAQAIDALTANTVEGFIAQIINHGKVKRMLCGLDEEPEGNKQSDGLALRSDIIENLGEYIQDNKRYKVNIAASDMQKVMTDYIYIKNFFRNKMNHASIDDDVDTVLTDYLTQKNYNTSDNITVEDIQNIMKGIIDHIENIKA